MKIIYKQGDLFSCSESILLHGVNCQGVMGSGVAKVVRDLYPKYYRMYTEFCALSNTPEELLGQIQICVPNNVDSKTLIHCFTQLNYGRDTNVIYCDYKAIRKCFRSITKEVDYGKVFESIAMPKIGAGLANGDWDIISNIIEEESSDKWQPVVYTI